MEWLFKLVCKIFGHRYHNDGDDATVFFTYVCRTCGSYKYVSKNKKPIEFNKNKTIVVKKGD